MSDEADMPREGFDSTLELLRRAREGGAEARERLFRRVLPAVKRWARGQVPREARSLLDSDDLVQDTVLRTLANLDRIEASRDRGFYLYLRETLRNRIRDELRRIGRQPAFEDSIPSQIPDELPDPLVRAIGREGIERYERALAALDPEEAAMVVARIEFALSWREIAETSGKPTEDAARVAVSRALAKIASDLGGER